MYINAQSNREMPPEGQGVVEPLGLFVGLSVVVTSIMLATLIEVKNLIFKEAI